MNDKKESKNKAEMQTRQQALQVQGLGHVLGEGRVKQARAGQNTRAQG